MASVRTRDRKKQPPLRLSIDLLANGRTLSGGYLFTPLGVDVDGHTRLPTGFPAQALSEEWPKSPFLFHIRELPIEDATDVVIGFDLMAEGEVWIDNVLVYDHFFERNELNELMRQNAPANFDLERRKFAKCQNYLDGFWPRFLLEYVPAAVARVAIPGVEGLSDHQQPS